VPQWSQHNYAAAIETLQGFLNRSQSHGRPAIDAEFFLGACYLLTGRLDDASEALGKALLDSPYREEAHFLMAETWLKKRDADHARSVLESVIAMNGDLRATAERLVLQLDAARHGRL
jgi:TolA-binding protein